MRNYIIHKTDKTPDDNFLFFTTIIAIFLAVKTEEYFIFAPIILLLAISLLFKLILFLKWQRSYVVALDENQIILNHTILYSEVKIPLSVIHCVSKRGRYMELTENHGIALPRFSVKSSTKNKIYFSTLSDNERKELFDKLEDFGVSSIL